MRVCARAHSRQAGWLGTHVTATGTAHVSFTLVPHIVTSTLVPHCCCNLSGTSYEHALDMNTLKSRLLTAKQRLQPVETRVITPDGRELREHRDVDGNVIAVVDPTARHSGFVGDTRPDMQMGLVEPGLYVGACAHTVCTRARTHTGGQDPASEAEYLKAHNITHIINAASCGVECMFPSQFTYLELDITDLPDSDIRQYFDRCYNFIDTCLTMGGQCFVHCNAGVSVPSCTRSCTAQVSRSTTIVCAYMMRRRGLSLRQALMKVKHARPCAQPNGGFMLQLQVRVHTRAQTHTRRHTMSYCNSIASPNNNDAPRALPNRNSTKNTCKNTTNVSSLHVIYWCSTIDCLVGCLQFIQADVQCAVC